MKGRRKQGGLFAARFRDTVLLSTVMEGQHRRLTDNDYVMVYTCLFCNHDIVFDTFPLTQRDLQPSGGGDEASGRVDTKIATLKQVIDKKPAAATMATSSSGLDLSSFLKKL